jgi:hypothetical protein
VAWIPGDTGLGYGALPRPPTIPGVGLDGVFKSWGQLQKLVNDTLPYLARRLANDLDRRRGG